jgi:hypothetical protein
MQERMQADRESSYIWVRDGSPAHDAIQEAAAIDEQPALDVLEILQSRHGDFDSAAVGEESEFDGDTYYTPKGPDDQAWHEDWNNFEHSLKREARFFSKSAGEVLAAVFGNVDQLKTWLGVPLVVSAGPQTELEFLYRARVFQADPELEKALGRPDLHLGPPPARDARAGRMNAQGIAVFYGATIPTAAIAEVRPPVGSRVVVAKFQTIRALRLLDLSALEGVHVDGSIFDPTLKRRLERASFLRTLGRRMARAVMPDDEAFDYLPTQAVADFLATMNLPRLDGIAFPSAQAGAGSNVVLFHHTARVESLVVPKGTSIDASSGYGTEDGWEIDYSVTEKVPPASSRQTAPSEPDDGFPSLPLADFPGPPTWDDDTRQAALRVDVQSLTVHDVDSVQVNTTPHPVDRYQRETFEPDF